MHLILGAPASFTCVSWAADCPGGADSGVGPELAAGDWDPMDPVDPAVDPMDSVGPVGPVMRQVSQTDAPLSRDPLHCVHSMLLFA